MTSKGSCNQTVGFRVEGLGPKKGTRVHVPTGPNSICFGLKVAAYLGSLGPKYILFHVGTFGCWGA